MHFLVPTKLPASSLMILNFSGVASLFSIMLQYLTYPLYNKIPSKSQHVFSYRVIFPMAQMKLKQSWMKLKTDCHLIGDIIKNPARKASMWEAFFYNHPSGDQEPTREDIKLTEEWYIRHLFGGMKQIGRMMKIPLKDHVIIGKGWFSFFERELNDKNWVYHKN